MVRTADGANHEAPVSDQLPLFPGSTSDAGDAATPDADALRARHESIRATAAALPRELRMGTSSWSFPGWRGIVYSSAATARTLAHDGLREYARHPLVRTVGIDRSFYAPIPEEDLRRYADQLPDDFVSCAKAPAAIVLEPFARSFAAHTGPFILQFPPLPPRPALEPMAFAEMLDVFLDRVPRVAEIAIELRDRSLITDSYRRVLERHAAVHVYNDWSAMPLPGEQARMLDPVRAPFTMVRLLMRPGTRYEQQRMQMAPFNRIVEQDEHMRRDVTAVLAAALRAGQRAFLLVNNKAEGSAPLTIEAIAARLVENGV